MTTMSGIFKRFLIFLTELDVFQFLLLNVTGRQCMPIRSWSKWVPLLNYWWCRLTIFEKSIRYDSTNPDIFPETPIDKSARRMDGLLPVKIWPLILWFCAGDLKAVRKFYLHIFSENTPAIRFLGLAKLFQVHYRLFLSVHLLLHPWVKIMTKIRRR